MEVKPITTEKEPKGWRMSVAIVLVAMSFGSTALIPFVTGSSLSTEMKATVSGLLVFGIPQVFMLMAVALIGKAGLNYLKRRLFGVLKGFAPAQEVSRGRYRLGLVLFVLPFILAFLTPYVVTHLPALSERGFVLGLVGDAVLLTSLFVLGGDFWDKLRALFVYDAKVHYPSLGR
jgi:hypothetical protein